MPVSARAGIVVTGTEVLTGRVQDANGPWIADRLLELGVELAHITICGDRPADIEAQLRFLADQGVDLIVTSGGLGPTADDMTVEVVARFCGRELVLDDETREQDRQHPQAPDGALRRRRLRRGARRQPQAGDGSRTASQVLDPVGTAPGVVVPGKPTVVVLPGPPRELQPMWRTAIETPAAQEAIAGRTIYRQDIDSDVRAARVGSGRNAARRRKNRRRLRRRSRSPPACGAARSKWSPATSRTPPTSTPS